MNLGRIFPNEASRNEAVEHFQSLRDNPDWIFLVEKLIQADITEITEKLLDPTIEWKDNEEKESKRIRAYWIILSQLPEELISALRENKEDIFEDSDPYYKSVREIKGK